MGLLKTYAIYKYGRKRGEKIYAQAVQDAAFEIKAERAAEAVEKTKAEKCTTCGWEKFRHGPRAECPVYPELNLN